MEALLLSKIHPFLSTTSSAKRDRWYILAYNFLSALHRCKTNLHTESRYVFFIGQKRCIFVNLRLCAADFSFKSYHGDEVGNGKTERMQWNADQSLLLNETQHT